MGKYSSLFSFRIVKTDNKIGIKHESPGLSGAGQMEEDSGSALPGKIE